MEKQLQNIRLEYSEKIAQAATLGQLDQLFLKLFGKNGVLTIFPKVFSKLAKEEVKVVAPVFSQVKADLEEQVKIRRNEVREKGYADLFSEGLELEGGKIKEREGHLHPLTQFEDKIASAFKKLGFKLYSAPHIDDDYNNFEVLNIPEEHPARDLWDTLYIESRVEGLESGKEKLLLRTHTSNGQIRIMKEFKPPFRMMLIDRCFRKENLDARHEHTFDQFDIVMVEKGLNMGNLQYLSEYFFKELFGPDIKARLKPKYYPFVEPGAGVDGLCIFCKGKGCKVCGNTGWLELAGAGMIHPTVLKNGGIDPKEFSGIAWGMGPARMAMLKWGIEDLRLFNSGDLKFLQKF